jgi:hypothetical protein
MPGSTFQAQARWSQKLIVGDSEDQSFRKPDECHYEVVFVPRESFQKIGAALKSPRAVAALKVETRKPGPQLLNKYELAKLD